MDRARACTSYLTPFAGEVRLRVADIDNNGAIDLVLMPVATAGGATGASIWLQDEAGTFHPMDKSQGPAVLFDVADLQGNGRLDLLGLSSDGAADDRPQPRNEGLSLADDSATCAPGHGRSAHQFLRHRRRNRDPLRAAFAKAVDDRASAALRSRHAEGRRCRSHCVAERIGACRVRAEGRPADCDRAEVEGLMPFPLRLEWQPNGSS